MGDVNVMRRIEEEEITDHDEREGSTRPPNEWKEPLICSTRLTLFLIFQTATANLVLQRFNINMGVVCMTQPYLKNSSHESHTIIIQDKFPDQSVQENNHFEALPTPQSLQLKRQQNDCPSETLTISKLDTDFNNSSTNPAPAPFSWTKETQGRIMAAFYYGLTLSQFPSAMIVDKYGGRVVLISSQLILSILSFLNPVCANLGAPYMFMVRFLQGAVAGPILAAINSLTTKWAGVMERASLLAITATGFSIASSLVYPVSGFICEYAGWEWIFYFPFGFGILWVLVALFVVYEWPEEHPRIQINELQFIQRYRAVQYRGSNPEALKIPWISLTRSAPLWAVLVSNFTCYWCFFTIGAYLPRYLNEVLHVNISKNGVLSALPFVGIIVAQLFAASVFDRLRKKDMCSVTSLRKIFNTFGTFGAAFCVAIIGMIPCDNSLVGNVVLSTLSQGVMEFAWMGGFYFSIFEIAPRFTSILTALENISCYLAGFLCAETVSWMTTDGTKTQWLAVFYLSAGINVLGGLFYLMFGSSELQSWAAAVDITVRSKEETDIDDGNNNEELNEHGLLPLHFEMDCYEYDDNVNHN